MAEKWKHNAVRHLERLAYGVEKLGEELERYNDLREAELENDGDT